METTIPVFPCNSLDETLEFYRALGFTVTHEQTKPYLYGAVQRGEVELHFAHLTGRTTKPAAGCCLAIVPAVESYHRAFADGLRAHYGRVPTASHPRITRLRPGQTRFHVYDPCGNVLIFIDRDEPETTYEEPTETLSPLAGSLDNATFLRDTYANDEAAARVLDKALERNESAHPVERARALAARAELAVALGDAARARAVRAELAQIPLSDEDRARFHHELQAADELEQWLTQKPDRRSM